jgi:aryl-alcohol dehydrogenase-like predicted oxidoreductase
VRYIEISGVATPVSVLGLGAGAAVFRPERYEEAAGILEAYLDRGGNCVDTANLYGLGKSEETLGRWIDESGRRADIVLITKACHPLIDPDDLFGRPWVSRVTPEALRADLDESLTRLRTDHVDVFLLHRDDETVPVAPLIEALNLEQERGRIDVFGASNWSVGRMIEANRYAAEHGLNGFVLSSPGLSLPRPVATYYPGTLFADDDTRRWHEATHFPLLAWASLAAGFVSGRFDPGDRSDDYVARVYYSDANFERVRRAGELGREKSATGLQIALAFVLNQPFPVAGLVGSSTLGHLTEALGAVDIELSADELLYLDLAEAVRTT